MQRFIYETIKDHLDKKQITLLLGARQVGKTTLLKQLLAEIRSSGKLAYFLSLEDKVLLKELDESPRNLFKLIPPLSSEKLYLFIDEIQYLGDPSNFLKFHYDEYHEKIKFIVTGSSSFYIDEKFKDSLAGRKRIFELPTLSFAEMLHFKQRDHLVTFINQGSIPQLIRSELNPLFYEYLIYGGYPEVVLNDSLNEKKLILKELWEAYAKKDAIEAKLHNPEIYTNLLKILSERIGALINANDLAANVSLERKSVERYLWVMKKSFHVHTLLPFHKNIASELRKMNKLYFADLGLRNSLLNNFSPIGQREDKGELIENYTYLLLRNYHSEDNIKFWRTQKKQEVDFIVQKDDGKSEAIEVKFNSNNFKPNKYAFFHKSYPEIPLICYDMNNVLSEKMNL
ncbi:MAG: ATP-binding protein [Lentisphaeria bacterium]|nr:ATP-binding protein [Lentisphaeria bacterium]